MTFCQSPNTIRGAAQPLPSVLSVNLLPEAEPKSGTGLDPLKDGCLQEHAVFFAGTDVLGFWGDVSISALVVFFFVLWPLGPAESRRNWGSCFGCLGDLGYSTRLV